MNIRVLNNSNEYQWEELVKKVDLVYPQHTLLWKKTIEKTYKNCKPLYFVFEDGKKIVGALPFFIVKSKIFGDRAISQPFIDFGGVIGSVDKQCFLEIVEYIKKNNKEVSLIEIRMNNLKENYKSIEDLLLDSGFIKSLKRYQAILKLKDVNETWDDLKRITKKGIKKAKKSSLNIIEVDNEKEVNNFYSLYFKSMKAFGTPQHSRKYFINLFNESKSMVKGLNCYKDKKIISSLIVFYTKDYVYAAYNFSNPKFLIFQPNDMLYWEIMSWASKKGLKYFDFGQCDPNAEIGSHASGIYKFKSKWNATLYERPYFHYNLKEEKISSSDNKKYKKMINLWKILPSFLIKIIGPRISSQLAL